MNNTICTNYFTSDECVVYARYWNLCCVYISVGFILYCLMHKMNDNFMKLMLFYLIIDMIIKPFLLSTLSL